MRIAMTKPLFAWDGLAAASGGRKEYLDAEGKDGHVGTMRLDPSRRRFERRAANPPRTFRITADKDTPSPRNAAARFGSSVGHFEKIFTAGPPATLSQVSRPALSTDHSTPQRKRLVRIGGFFAQALRPPSTGRICPVMKSLPRMSERTASATSCASATRRMGVCICAARTKAVCPSTQRVFVTPGATALTRISGASSRAMTRVTTFSAALEAQ